jgi:hypothetical protein
MRGSGSTVNRPRESKIQTGAVAVERTSSDRFFLARPRLVTRQDPPLGAPKCGITSAGPFVFERTAPPSA